MGLPTEFGDLTVEQYQECDKILKDKNQDEFLLDLTAPVRLIAYLLGVTEDDVLNMDIPKEYAKLSFLNSPDKLYEIPTKDTIVAGRTVYRANLKTPEMKAGALIGLKFYESRPNPIEFLHDQLSCVYLPVNLLGITRKYNAKRHKKISEDMKKAKLKDVYGFLVFKKKVFEALSPVMETYLKEATNTIQGMMPEVMEWAKKEGLLAS